MQNINKCTKKPKIKYPQKTKLKVDICFGIIKEVPSSMHKIKENMRPQKSLNSELSKYSFMCNTWLFLAVSCVAHKAGLGQSPRTQGQREIQMSEFLSGKKKVNTYYLT